MARNSLLLSTVVQHETIDCEHDLLLYEAAVLEGMEFGVELHGQPLSLLTNMPTAGGNTSAKPPTSCY